MAVCDIGLCGGVSANPRAGSVTQMRQEENLVQTSRVLTIGQFILGILSRVQFRKMFPDITQFYVHNEA